MKKIIQPVPQLGCKRHVFILPSLQKCMDTLRSLFSASTSNSFIAVGEKKHVHCWLQKLFQSCWLRVKTVHTNVTMEICSTGALRPQGNILVRKQSASWQGTRDRTDCNFTVMLIYTWNVEELQWLPVHLLHCITMTACTVRPNKHALRQITHHRHV